MLIRNFVISLLIFTVSLQGCSTVAEVKKPVPVSSVPKPGTVNTTDTQVSIPVPAISPTPSSVTETVIVSQSPVPSSSVSSLPVVLPLITVENLSLYEGKSGTEVTLNGKNFSSSKTKNIIFVNDVNKEFNAEILALSDTSVTFKVPPGTDAGLLTLYEMAGGKYYYAKIIVLSESGQKASVGTFKIIIPVTTVVSAPSGGSSGGSVSIPAATPTPSATPTQSPTPTPVPSSSGTTIIGKIS